MIELETLKRKYPGMGLEAVNRLDGVFPKIHRDLVVSKRFH